MAFKRYPLKVTRLLFTSTLTSYGLEMPNPHLELIPHVDALAECSPHLKRLHVRWDYGSHECVVPMDHHPSTSLSDKFRRFSSLRELAVKSINILPPAIQILGALPSLQDLSMSISSADYPAKWKTAVPVDGSDFFPQLRNLSCTVDDLMLLTAIIQASSSPFLEGLHISSSLSYHASFERLCEVLSLHTSRKTLRSLSHTGWLGEPCDLNTAFMSLTALPSITNVTLKTSSIIMLSDDTLDAMARAWPRLERLDLHQYKYDPQATFESYFSLYYQATLHGLNSFAQHCPSLKVLALSIDPWCEAFATVDDAGDPGWAHDFPPVPPSRSALQNLYVGFMEAEYPLQVAGILSGIFPHLLRVDYGDDGELSRWHGWEEVNRTLGAFHRVRKQERRRVGERVRPLTAEA